MRRCINSNINRILLTPVVCLVALALLFACSDKKGKRIVIKPQAVAKEDSVFKQEQVYVTARTNIVDSFFTSINKNHGFNGAVLVTDSSKIIYKKTFGYADFSTKEPLTELSIFQLASVSKQFTAVAIMMLYERGLLSYNDEVTDFFPDFPYKGINVRMLLTHRSGLPNYTYFCEEYYTNKNVALTNFELIDLMVKHKPLVYFPPNRKFNYCNTNYCILAAIVEKVSQTPFADFITNHIFKPSGMNHSFIGFTNQPGFAKLIVNGYDENNKPIKWDYMDGILGDKGVYSCIDDLNRWDKILYTSTLVKESTLKEAMQPGSKDMIGSRNYGFGWRIKFLEDKTPLYYHGGWWKGYNTYFMRNPKEHSSIIILSNKVNWSFNEITSFIPQFYNQKSDSKGDPI